MQDTHFFHVEIEAYALNRMWTWFSAHQTVNLVLNTYSSWKKNRI